MKPMKMTRFSCHSQASTAVCMTGDPRSVIVPRRPDQTYVDHAKLLDWKYSRLLESKRFALGGADKRSALAIPSRRDRAVTKAPSKPGNVPSLPSNNVFQVVVMRVSLHCQGCAGKVKKHLSKMEGVTSFSIDLESKRVTVMGHVSPVVVLESISKVKKAEFWPCSDGKTPIDDHQPRQSL
ncbi:protein SODIUM POTASSIUM ROOT DEFECTIVE 3-like [Aristolochia californica]|uniref:protein SODIUM POTASSIUM ROOT DEFECTIVE 3-like n=1 Tax=Aristolochia californica TaxID=171875 RepID=UPI0035DF80DE